MFYSEGTAFYIDRHDISEALATALCDFLHHHFEEEVFIYIDSDGGEIEPMLDIVQAMKKHEGKINTIASGYVASAALTIFFCGDYRVACKDTEFLFHRAVAHIEAGTDEVMTPKDLQMLADSLIEDTAKMFTLAVEHTHCEYEDLMRYTENYTDWKFGTSEAIFAGFADEVMDNGDE